MKRYYNHCVLLQSVAARGQNYPAAESKTLRDTSGNVRGQEDGTEGAQEMERCEGKHGRENTSTDMHLPLKQELREAPFCSSLLISADNADVVIGTRRTSATDVRAPLLIIQNAGQGSTPSTHALQKPPP
jgi:hypothetical protein|eukprot:CAMPEP_0174307834 /NCGR_PEP_ID=MMETSP0810-20121108/1368_1 /TAXON_ID=73025 ORGANISM="Eutreptiella gymnastica-like, Strain CCMP1594" /NCGR_SAMPLE_ID=MMETSP0810 /ASSEMBLY_ACC=CAM_ASM_000659 /LENGTH=129 /DNA_ID=CAMNT_0015414987 /DNA_START=659 /DNA_END=1048 /DNA_ORIENTATION=-